MNWIKSNPFVSILAGITLFLCAILLFVAISAGSKYSEAKMAFDDSYQSVSTSESIELYPKAENRAAKAKALTDYRSELSEFRSLFDPYRKSDLEQISPQEFTVRLKAASEKVTKALRDNGCTVPDGFFLGFESYRTKLANSAATGVLNYQLKGFEHAMMDLAAAKPSEILKVYRDPAPEESGGEYEVPEDEVARFFPIEVAFKGSEDSARKFLSSLAELDPHYYVVRCVSIENESNKPPKVSDATFEKPQEEASMGSEPEDSVFADFVLPGEEGSSEGGEESNEESTVAMEEPAAEVDSSKILAQVLGGEEIIVFVRFDLSLFHPAEELPVP